jgi:hypothetical protein
MKAFIGDTPEAGKVDQKISELVEILVSMDQRYAADCARGTASFLIAFLADIGVMNPNLKVASAALEHIGDLEFELMSIRNQIQDCNVTSAGLN